MNMQNSIDDAKRQLVKLEQECEELFDSAETASLAWKKQDLLAQIKLWEFLQTNAEKEPHLYVSTSAHIDILKCDAFMITAGGIYIYQLLPTETTSVQVQWPRIQVGCMPEGLIWEMGAAKRHMLDVIKRLSLTSIPIYEVYITPPSLQPLFACDGTLICSFQQLTQFFDNLVFRENPLYDAQEVLRNYLAGQSYSRESEHMVEEQKGSNEVGEVPSVKEEKQRVALEVEKHTAAVEVAVANEQTASPITETKLPPRRRKETNKKQGWIARLFTKK